MKCPRCEQSVLDERVRDGVTIDVCRDCRGIWLDRSGLERIISRALDEQERIAAESRSREAYRPGPSSAPGGYYHGGRDRDSTPPHGHRYGDPRYHGKRKRHWFEELFD